MGMFGSKVGIKAHNIITDLDLAVAKTTRPDPYNGDMKFRRNLLPQ